MAAQTPENIHLRRASSSKSISSVTKHLFRAALLASVILILLFTLHHPLSLLFHDHPHSLSSLSSITSSDLHSIRRSATATNPTGGLVVFVTGAAGFIGTHCSLALKRRGDGVLGLDNFNPHLYHPSLKRSRQSLLAGDSIYIVDGDLNDHTLLISLFTLVTFSHVLHLAAQAGVRYAMKNPQSYVASNVAGFVNLLDVCKSFDPKPAVVWASSSSVYGLNEAAPFSEDDRTDRPASLYAATKKAGEEIAHVYHHIYGLSLTALRFFTVYGAWGRPDMAYFSFTKAILERKPITIFKKAKTSSGEEDEVARDFTYIDDVVNGCLRALDTAERSGSGELRVYNLGNTTPVQIGLLG